MSLTRIAFRLLALLATFAIGSPMIVGQEHEDDILIYHREGQIAFWNSAPSILDAQHKYEAFFPTEGFVAGFTSDPGFESWPDFLNPSEQLTLNFLPSRFDTFLTVFDPFSNSFLLEHDYFIRVTNPTVTLSPIDISATEGGSRVLGNASANNGYFHIHPDFRLSSDAPFAAYGLLMTLSSNAPEIADSDPFWVIFNYGLSEAEFSHSVNQFTGIPEPSSLMLISAFSLAVLFRRQRPANSFHR